MTTAIEVQRATRSFRRTTALSDVSFTVPEGSICGLLGRNGSGKTTVMAAIAGQDRLTSGSVRVFGEQPFENAGLLRDISYIRDNQRYPDDYYLHHALRGASAFAPRWDAAYAERLAGEFGLPTKTAVRKFSRGQLSALAVILGLSRRAPVTLLDEPYLGLDISSRRLFYELLLADLDEFPRTILLATHLVAESEAMLDRVVILDRGRTALEASVGEAAELAHTVTGPADAVARVVGSGRVLSRTETAGLAGTVVSGPATGEHRAAAAAAGVSIASASLSDVVAAYGGDADDADASSREGAAA